jgi:hypothetical protein
MVKLDALYDSEGIWLIKGIRFVSVSKLNSRNEERGNIEVYFKAGKDLRTPGAYPARAYLMAGEDGLVNDE